jgi:hypothetical protein
MLQGIVEKGEMDCVGLDKYKCYVRVSFQQQKNTTGGRYAPTRFSLREKKSPQGCTARETFTVQRPGLEP